MGLAHRIEGYVWLARPPLLIDSAMYATAGWYVGFGGFDLRLLLVFISVWALRGGGLALNDVLDYPKDRVTAPSNPIPSGAVSLRGATTFGGGLVLLGLASGAAASVDALAALSIVGAFVACLGLLVVYSKVKEAGFVASLVGSIQISLVGVIGWLAGGAGDPGLFAIMFVALTMFGVRQNIMAGLRDIDTDPEVGNITTAVRLGVVGSVNAVLRLTALTAVLVGVVSVIQENWVGTAFCAVAAAVPLAAMPAMRRRFAEDAERSRASRSADLKDLARYSSPAGIAFPFAMSPVAGVLCFVGHRALWSVLWPIYNKRVINGALARVVAEPRPSV
jgi:4-hydroxybenzoate polyprenyltransferase